MKTITEVLNTAIPEATQAILAGNEITISPDSSDEGLYDVVAVIGFSGDGFGGSLGFAAQSSLVKAAFGDSDTLMSDSWLGEVTNMLLGRLKNALLAYGVEVQLAIPMVLHGLNLQIRRPPGGRIQQFNFSADEGACCVWVDADWEFDTELELVDADQHAKAEGEMMMF